MFEIEDESEFVPDYDEDISHSPCPKIKFNTSNLPAPSPAPSPANLQPTNEHKTHTEASSSSTNKKKIRQFCCVCGQLVSRLKRHAQTHHLPFLVAPRTSCWECMMQFNSDSALAKHMMSQCHKSKLSEWKTNWGPAMNALLDFLAELLSVNTNGLMDLINVKHLIPDQKCALPEDDVELLTLFDENFGDGQCLFEFNPISSPTLLTHWRSLLGLTSLLNDTDKSRVHRFIPPNVHAIQSHLQLLTLYIHFPGLLSNNYVILVVMIDCISQSASIPIKLMKYKSLITTNSRICSFVLVWLQSVNAG